MRGLMTAILFSLMILGWSQLDAADDPVQDPKKDNNPTVTSKDDTPKKDAKDAPKPEPGKDAPKTEPGKDAPKPEPGKDAPKTEPGKDAPKPEPGKDTPKTEPGKDAPKPEPGKDTPKPEPGKDAPKSEPGKAPAKPDATKDKDAKMMEMPRDEKKKEEKKDNGMIKVGEIQGKVIGINEEKKSLKVSVPVLNPDVVMALARAEMDLQRANSPQALYNAQSSIAQNQMKLYSKTQDVELTGTEDLIVRLQQPAPQFDDRGKLKRLTAKEKAELKGDPKLPGYKGEFSDLRTNQYVKLTLVKSKNAKMPKIKPGAKEIDPAILEELKPHFSMVLIIGEQRTPGQ